MANTSKLRPLPVTAPGSSQFPAGQVFHGGKSFEAIGVAFDHLERAESVVNADVLDAWFDPSPGVIEKLRDFLPFLARTSPPVRAAGLVEAIARHRGVPEDCLLAGGGSSDLIFACLPRLLEAGSRALLLDPMYGEYRYLLSTVMGAEVVLYSLCKTSEFAIDTGGIAACVQVARPDLIVLVNPNSPTGQHWQRLQVCRFLDNLPDSTTVVVDETYIEYAGSQESVEQEVPRRPNLVVIKSMSKVYALSGLRVGYLVAHPSVIYRLAPWIPPWSVSLPAQVAAIEALDDPAYYREQYSRTAFLRDELTSLLRCSSKLKIYGSMANFILVETPSSAQKIVDELSRENLFLRSCDSMSDQFHDRFIRIAVRRQHENKRIANALELALERPSPSSAR